MALNTFDRIWKVKDGGWMKLWFVLVGSVAALIGIIVLFGVVPDCGQPTGLHWMFSWSKLCRTGLDPAVPIEPSAIYAVPLAIMFAAWLIRKLTRTKDAV